METNTILCAVCSVHRDITDKLVKDYSCEQIISMEIKSIAAIKAKRKKRRNKKKTQKYMRIVPWALDQRTNTVKNGIRMQKKNK